MQLAQWDRWCYSAGGATGRHGAGGATGGNATCVDASCKVSGGRPDIESPANYTPVVALHKKAMAAAGATQERSPWQVLLPAAKRPARRGLRNSPESLGRALLPLH